MLVELYSDNDNGSRCATNFEPGDVLAGRVIVQVKVPVEIIGITVILRASVHSTLCSQRLPASALDAAFMPGQEQLFRTHKILKGSFFGLKLDSVSNEVVLGMPTVTLRAGQHVLPFTLNVPSEPVSKVLPTCEMNHDDLWCAVYYTLSVILEQHSSRNISSFVDLHAAAGSGWRSTSPRKELAVNANAPVTPARSPRLLAQSTPAAHSASSQSTSVATGTRTVATPPRRASHERSTIVLARARSTSPRASLANVSSSPPSLSTMSQTPSPKPSASDAPSSKVTQVPEFNACASAVRCKAIVCARIAARVATSIARWRTERRHEFAATGATPTSSSSSSSRAGSDIIVCRSRA
jgi:hypothetical protein